MVEEEEIAKRKEDYLQFRRKFDTLKKEHEGTSESENLKAHGNNFFALGCYVQAGVFYSEAIELQPLNPILYSNRSMAYLKQGLADEALADAESSLRLDASKDNIKAYWRQAQALLDLKRYAQAEAAADAGLALQASSPHLNQVRKEAREALLLERLSCGGVWVCKMDNGVEKRFRFSEDKTMSMSLFEHEVFATFDLSVEGNPRSFVVRMKEDRSPRGPPPPPIPYIFEFHGTGDEEELWLCHPVGTNELPQKFEGPGFDRMKKLKVELPSKLKMAEYPLEERCKQYISEMISMMPLNPPQLPQEPSRDQVSQEVFLVDRLATLKRAYGLEVHQYAILLAKEPEHLHGDHEHEDEHLLSLALELRKRLIARRIIAPGSGRSRPSSEEVAHWSPKGSVTDPGSPCSPKPQRESPTAAAAPPAEPQKKGHAPPSRLASCACFCCG